MSRVPLELIHGYLDLTLNQDEMIQLETWIKTSPENTKEFIELILIHEQLRSEYLVMDHNIFQNNTEVNPKLKQQLSRRILTLVTAASVVFVIGIMSWQFSGPSALAANIELQRIIQANGSLLDKSYHVKIEQSSQKTRSRDLKGTRYQPDIDGAILHIRGSNQYVLIRQLTDGSEFITGSNGENAWSVPPIGQVRVSQDLRRFRGALPGEKFDIPFINIRENLYQLLKIYHLSISEKKLDSDIRQIHAYRKANVSGGPKEVTIWYHEDTGLIQSMFLGRLPQARGGPRSILIELIGTDNLGPEFFDHNAHHDISRVVIEE